MVGNFPDQVLVDHWANRINSREPDLEENIYKSLVKMEDIIEDIPPSYRQWLDLTQFQIDFLIGVMEGKLKTFVKWVQHNKEFNLFFYFCERFCHLLNEMYEGVEEEPMEEDPSEDEAEE